jgi:hypothetical protein
MKAKCCICDKDAKIVLEKHWKTGLIIELTENTCGEPDCVREYEASIEEGFRLAEEEFEFRKMMEEIDDAKS